MANLLVEKESLEDIADAIRAKNGSSTTYKPSEMAGAISAIPSGGITPTGTKQITTNGTHDVTNYASAQVNVPTGITPSGSQTFTENGTYDVTSLSQAVVNVQGSGYTIEDIIGGGITGAVTTNATTMQTPLYGQNLTEFIAPDMTETCGYAFANCKKLSKVNLHSLTSFGTYMFQNCKSLKVAAFPMVTSALQPHPFNGSGIEIVDLYSSCPSFYVVSGVQTVILRGNSVAGLPNGVNSFSSTHFDINKAGGTLYVPQALITEYQNATNWSTVLAKNANNRILPIEGSIYETQYADGTPIE